MSNIHHLGGRGGGDTSKQQLMDHVAASYDEFTKDGIKPAFVMYIMVEPNGRANYCHVTLPDGDPKHASLYHGRAYARMLECIHAGSYVV